jgi:CRISPR-associated endonuclease/helicase Cas3
VLLRIECSPDHERIAGFSRDVARSILDAATESFEDQDQSERVRRDSLAQLLAAMRGDKSTGDLTPVISAAVSLLQGKITDSEVILRTGISSSGDDDEDGARIVVLDKRRAVADEDLRQVFAPRGTHVLLRDHQGCVAARAQALGVALRFPTELTEALRVAGEHHDDGKADRRFQEVRLGHYGDGEPWAKSDPSKSRADVRRQQAIGGLPNGWRHEQRSVVDGWDAAHAVSAIDAELALRLIGTSHGHGRSGFPHSASELARRQESIEWQELAVDLFDAGGWDELIEATHLRYGAWGCAFLEAILRAGDCQVSGEGK